jgi:hypothetical protein
MALEKAKIGMIGNDFHQQNCLYHTISNISSTGIQLEKSLPFVNQTSCERSLVLSWLMDGAHEAIWAARMMLSR